jgi:hypothetical protein
VDASGSFFGFGGSAKVDFITEANFTQFSIYMLVRVTAWDAFESFDSPVLSQDASDLIQNNNTIRFRERFGDTFIDGLKKGGEFFALYVITGSDQTEQETLATQIDAAYNGLLASADLETSINTKINSSSSHLQLNTHVFQAGSIDVTPTTPGQIIARASAFPPSVAGDLAYPYAVSLADYDTLNLPSDAFNPIDVQQQQDNLQDLARKRFAFLTRANDIDYVLAHPDDFQEMDATALGTVHDALIGDINSMEQQASTCFRDATQCAFTVFDINKYPPLPSPKTREALPALPTAGAWYYVVSFFSGLNLDNGGTEGLGPVIVQAAPDPNEVWAVVPAESAGYYYIRSKNTRLFLGDCGASKTPGTMICQSEQDPAQVWSLTPSPDHPGYFFITSRISGLNLHVPEYAKPLAPGEGVGANLIQQLPHPDQVWQFVQAL